MPIESGAATVRGADRTDKLIAETGAEETAPEIPREDGAEETPIAMQVEATTVAVATVLEEVSTAGEVPVEAEGSTVVAAQWEAAEKHPTAEAVGAEEEATAKWPKEM